MAEESAKNGADRATPARSRRYWLWVGGPVVAFAVLVGLILATGTPQASSLMKDAAGSFGGVERGTFRFAITITPQGGSDAAASSIELSGPFEIVPGKPLPRARITYSVKSGGRGQDVELLTTGDKAYTVIKGQAYELPATATKDLKEATSDLNKDGKSSGLSGLRLNFDKWLVDPRVSDGGEVDGTATWRTEASVDIVEALKDLAASMGTLNAVTGQSVPKLKDSQINEIKKQIKAAKVVVYVGRYDHIVRTMDLTMLFKTPDSAAAETGGITGGSMRLLVGISEPNQPVNVPDPKNPLPYSALQSLVNSQSSQTGTTLDDGVGK